MEGDQTVIVSGSVAVVWCVTHDTTHEEPARVLDINTEGDIIDDFTITVNVEGKEMWLLDVSKGVVSLTHFPIGGGEIPIAVPGEDMAVAFTPPDGVPAKVWALAVSEAHLCPAYQGDCCREIVRELAASGLLN